MSNTLTITDLTNTLAAANDITKKAAKEQIEAVIALITTEVVAGNTVRINGLGTFSVVDRDARVGRNPQTGAELQIPASKAVKFKATTALKTAVNGGVAEDEAGE
ncbi:MAG: HU family DNA-binding protein [Janthinobacterium sp.]